MKVSHLTLSSILLSILPQQSASLKCGIKGITGPCIGDTDIRYNPDVSYDLKDQDNFWALIEGLYISDECSFLPDGTIQTNVIFPGLEEAGLGSWSGCGYKTFSNYTFDGSRYIWHAYNIAKHNGDGPGGLQLPGYALPIDYYGVSTFEKNAEIVQLGTAAAYPDGGDFSVDTENLSTLTPIGSKSFMALLEENDNIDYMYETSFCTDSECNRVNKYSEFFLPPTDDGVRELKQFRRASFTKVDTKTWMEGISQAYVDCNIPPPDAPFTTIPGFDSGLFVQPFDPTTSDSAPECFTRICPTEKDWKVRDPNLGTSPYIEPDGVLTGGFISGVTIASIAVALLIFYVIYKRGLENRERRVKEAVLKSIAKTMTLTTSKELSPSDLTEMFQKIDVDGNGNLSKSEVKGLVDEAGVANMSDRDYDVLFASIDLDGNGTLDFTEFCAFFASISIAESDTFAEA